MPTEDPTEVILLCPACGSDALTVNCLVRATCSGPIRLLFDGVSWEPTSNETDYSGEYTDLGVFCDNCGHVVEGADWVTSMTRETRGARSDQRS